MRTPLKTISYSFLCFLILALFLQSCSDKKGSGTFESLVSGFIDPPDSVRPGVYWYFMDGNLSREAMTADLESIKEVGIGQVVFLEVNVGLPRGSVDFLSEEWQDLFKHAVREAERLGIEITLGIGPGWTGSGGPWVKPEQSMIHLMSSTVNVSGPSTYEGTLPVPGPYPPFFGEESVPANLKEIRDGFYEDVVVLAFPETEKDTKIADSDEKALYYRAPFSSQPGVKPFLPATANYASLAGDEIIDKGKIVDITGFMKPGGQIHWDVPEGKWTIMRFGKRNNGAVTRPAPEPGLGFECDKFDTVAFNAHFDQFVGKLLRKVEPRIKARHSGWTLLHMDSWEMSAQNWTGSFREEFNRRRGYDPLPYLPAYAGKIVGTLEESERFLWDMRLTSQELVIEYHARHVKELARRYGMRLSIEPYDMNPCADLPLGEVADVPMCEFWSKGLGFNTVFSCFEAASLAHVQGLPVVASESFTAGFDEAWRMYPAVMKNQGDWAFCSGVNRFNYHTFAHKPYGDHLRPGMTMGPYGVHWDRGQTWWPMAKAYHTYISRCSYMLQQGHNIADILYLIPEGAPHVFLPPASALEGNDSIPDHRGYNFDVCSPGMLISKASVKDGRIIFPGGASYSILVLPGTETMTPELLTKIKELVENGAVVMGKPPLRSPSLVNFPQCDSSVKEIAQKLWSNPETYGTDAPHQYGKGEIWKPGTTSPASQFDLYPNYGTTISVLKKKDIPEDFSSDDNEIRFIHRVDGDLDIYFIANRSGMAVKTNCHFRTERGTPVLLDPMTGVIAPLGQYNRAGGQTAIPMQFEPYQSFFVVFGGNGKNYHGKTMTAENFPELSVVMELQDNWKVKFDPKWGGPGEVKFDRLSDWSQNKDEGIRFYSGIATYETIFDLPEQISPENTGETWLDLSEVYHMARITMNGKDLGVVWAFPWRVNITGALQKKANILTVDVANLWINRLIGDAYKPYDGQVNNRWPEWLLQGKPRTSGRFTFTTYDYYKKDSPLVKSGLTGPVRILAAGK